jgi:hypothetical protein
MQKKSGWLWIIAAIVVFAINFMTFGNSSVFSGQWASTLSSIIGYAVCPILLLIGIGILIMGKK